MEMIKWAALSLFASCSPVMAQDCADAKTALDNLVKNGYSITFGDGSGDWALFMAEDGKGGWIVFGLKEGELCVAAYGGNGVHVDLPPNI